ncbi:DUF5518 domain-containing protein [Natrinema altunense]|uniref:DUF5518 domain-containing protein n=1 Tax=Natrinema altunense (strain JCM 12890 / CGMCC 1.3731 / AJ2) TaxID=1227494 RepID=L9ZDN0_NATA2|nr:DUF5518 domain-containing protein [Natrinema altunense]ELY84484.1 hypothetical protein C485_14040 [Natrinema altunense JCM 12890]
MVSTRTFINAVIGAIVGVVLSFIPGSTILGGAVAGFLEGPDERAGTVAGVIAGLVMFLPIATGGALVFGFLGLGLLGGAPGGGIAVLSIFVVIALLVVLAYTVGLSALGGYLGAYLACEYPDTRRRTRDTIGFSTASEHPSRTADVPPPSDRDADSLSTRDRDPDTMRGWDRDGRSDREPSDGSDEDRYPDRDRDREPKR